ncbi:MAG: LCP family protein, partial [Erysipelotrichaceae bacterium]|nr:LCP family protein [Erysipelotrichaceae bacterium]
GTKRSMEDIDKSISYETVEYSNYADELADLYAGDIDAIILNDANRSMIYEIEIYGHFSTQTKVLHETKWKTKRTTEVYASKPVDVTAQPFTVLITGNDSYGGLSENSRSDSNMLVTVNPTSNQVLMTSIPRDTYMDMVCTADSEDCPDGEKDKLTHSGLYGVGTTAQSLEKYFDIDINYFVRVNFSSLVNLVDALGGIDVEVGEGLAVDSFRANEELEGVHEGMNHLDGERALAYSRERYAYEDGDAQRVKNQQQVLRAIIQKIVSPTMITHYGAFVDALGESFETNMSSAEMMSLIRNQLLFNPEWKFNSYGLDGDGDTQYCPSIGDAASVMILDPGAYQTAVDKIQAVLDGKNPKDIKDMSEKKEEEVIEEEVEEQTETETYDSNVTQQPQYYSQQPQDQTYDPYASQNQGYGYGY